MRHGSGKAYRGIDRIDISIELCSLDGLPADFASVLEYWKRITPPGALGPCWTDFELINVPPGLLPDTLVVDCLPGEDSYRYRYWGRGLTDVFGVDLSGQSFDKCPRAFADISRTTYDLIRREKRPLFIKLHTEIQGEQKPFQNALRLPLSADGETVTAVVSLTRMRYLRHEWNALWV